LLGKSRGEVPEKLKPGIREQHNNNDNVETQENGLTNTFVELETPSAVKCFVAGYRYSQVKLCNPGLLLAS
jgi:hypothetical protein